MGHVQHANDKRSWAQEHAQDLSQIIKCPGTSLGPCWPIKH